MDTATVIQVIAGILFVIGLVVLIQRHRKKAV
jgi:hypothetical protein